MKLSKIEGKVLDLNTGEALAGVAISINESEQVVYTDIDGNYSIENLAPGTYELVASFISYKNSLIEDVELDADKYKEIIIHLQSSN